MNVHVLPLHILTDWEPVKIVKSLAPNCTHLLCVESPGYHSVLPRSLHKLKYQDWENSFQSIHYVKNWEADYHDNVLHILDSLKVNWVVLLNTQYTSDRELEKKLKSKVECQELISVD